MDLRVNGFWSGEVVLLIKSVCRSSKKAWLSKLNVWYIRGTGRGGRGYSATLQKGDTHVTPHIPLGIRNAANQDEMETFNFKKQAGIHALYLIWCWTGKRNGIQAKLGEVQEKRQFSNWNTRDI